MCKSAAEGGLRCAAHLKSELINHKHNETWEVIKSAAENGTPFEEPELSEADKLKIRMRSSLDVEHADYAEQLAQANASLNAEYSKYDLALSTKDPNEVARYLYESSPVVLQSRADLAKAKRAYDTRIAEIDYNAKAQQESGISREEPHTPSAKQKFREAIEAHRNTLRNSLRVEDALMKQMRQAEASGDTPSYDQNLAAKFRESQEEVIQAEREVRWAKQDLEVAEDYDRRNYFAVFNPEGEREKAKSQYRSIQKAILEETSRERKYAVLNAPFALAGYKKGNPDSMRFSNGPLKGTFPNAIAQGRAQVAEFTGAKEKSLKLAEKKLTREVTRSKIAQTNEFREYKNNVFPGTERGKAYKEKDAKLQREYKLTETYEDFLSQKRDAALAEGKPVGALEAEINEVRSRRALHVMTMKNNYARSLVATEQSA